MNIVILQLWQTVLAPALVAGVLLYFRFLLPPVAAKYILAVVLPLATATTMFLILGLPEWPPQDGLYALFFVLLLSGIWALLSREKSSKWWLNIFKILAMALVIVLLLKNMMIEEWSFNQSLINVTLLLFPFVSLWQISEYFSKDKGKTLLPVTFLFTFASLSIYCLLQGSMSLAQIIGATAVSIGVLFLMNIRWPKELPIQNLISFFFFIGLGYCINIYYFLEVPAAELIMFSLPIAFHGGGIIVAKKISIAKFLFLLSFTNILFFSWFLFGIYTNSIR